MKHITLKSIEFEDKSIFDYKEAMLAVLAKPINMQAGANYEEMRVIIPIMDKVTAANGVLSLEDAEHQALMVRAKSMPYRVVNKIILQFVDDIVHAPSEKKDESLSGAD